MYIARKIDSSKNILENVNHNRMAGAQKVAKSDKSASVYISSYRRCAFFLKRGGNRYHGRWILLVNENFKREAVLTSGARYSGVPQNVLVVLP